MVDINKTSTGTFFCSCGESFCSLDSAVGCRKCRQYLTAFNFHYRTVIQLVSLGGSCFKTKTVYGTRYTQEELEEFRVNWNVREETRKTELRTYLRKSRGQFKKPLTYFPFANLLK